MTKTVTGLQVVGEGVLANAIATAADRSGIAVRTSHEATSDAAPDGSMAVLANDAWDVGSRAMARTLYTQNGAPWIPVHTELGEIVVGPAELPGTRGCATCAESRRRLARPDPQGHDAVYQRHGATMATRPSSWLTELAADLTASVVVDEVSQLATGSDSARTRNALLRIGLDKLDITVHSFLPDPRCEICGDLPDDSPQLADITLAPRPKPSPETFRVRTVADRWEELERTYIDAECGMVHPPGYGSEGGLITAYTMTGIRDGGPEFGFGRTSSYRESRQVALLETLERYGGCQPGGKRTVVRGSYADLRDRALDPRRLGLYPPERIAQGIPYRSFTENATSNWVWAYSFARSAPILVPESYAYYRARNVDPDNPPFAYECSNGSALGGCLEEAILYGILEVAERDAFLMTWYGRIPAPRIDLESASDPTIPLLAEMIRSEMGYEVLAFDITMEQGIPCVWVMAVNPRDDNERPKTLCAAGSHLLPERALARALNELGPMLATFNTLYPGQRERARMMAENPSLVMTMEQHHHLYGNPDVFARLDFLTESSSPGRRLSDMPRVPTGTDLSDDLQELARRYLDEGMDLIVVNQTTPEHRAGGFCCAKAIIPGTLPMTFGYDYRRVDGLPRLYEVPHRLGYRHRPLRPAEINPHPHPFP